LSQEEVLAAAQILVLETLAAVEQEAFAPERLCP
jgi:hypothetical protein